MSKAPFRIFCVIIFGIHLTWVCVHMVMVYYEMVNPWKLGGYAMYTVPAPCFSSHVFWIDSDGVQQTIPVDKKIRSSLIKDLSAGCISRPDLFYEEIISQNKIGNGETIFVDYYKHTFSASKPSTEYDKIGGSEIYYSNSVYTITEDYCDEIRVFQIPAEA